MFYLYPLGSTSLEDGVKLEVSVFCEDLTTMSFSQFHQHFTSRFCTLTPKKSKETVIREKLHKALLYEKGMHKMWMKLTPCIWLLFYHRLWVWILGVEQLFPLSHLQHWRCDNADVCLGNEPEKIPITFFSKNINKVITKT